MANYTKVFTKPYADGYEDLPSQTTPITAETLNDKDDTLEHIEGYLYNNPIAEVVDNLTSNDATKALSAKQGKILNDTKLNVADLPNSDIQTSTTGQFTTVTGGLMQSCVVDLDPIQDLRGYSKPWVGGSGKNKCNPDTFVQGLLNYSTGVLDSAVSNWITSDFIQMSGTVTLSGYMDGTEKNFCVRLCEYDATKVFIKNTNNPNVTGNTTWSRTITLDSNTRYVRTSVGFDNKATTVSAYFATNRLQIELGSQATSYEPYSNICPISGHTSVEVWNHGKNFIKNNLIVNGTYKNVSIIRNKDNSVTFNGTADGEIYNNTWLDNDLKLEVGRYTLSGNQTGLNIQICNKAESRAWYNFNNGQNSSFDVTAEMIGDMKIRFIIPNGNTLNNVTAYPMIHLASNTDATYEPYQGQDIIVALGGTYYGGTLDAVSGVLTVTHKYTDITAFAMRNGSTANKMFITNPISDARRPSTNLENVYPICNRFDNSNSYDYLYGPVGAGIAINSNGMVGVAFGSTSEIDTLEKANTWLSSNPLQVVYKLATPIIIQLDPQTLETLVGQNDVFAPLVGQSVEEVEYREVLAFEDVPKAIPYENVAPDMGTGEDRTYFRIKKYGRLVQLEFIQSNYWMVVEQQTKVVFGVLPDGYYDKQPWSALHPDVEYEYPFVNETATNQYDNRKLFINMVTGEVYSVYQANDEIHPMGSITYILDHD